MDEDYVFAGDMRPNPYTGGIGRCTADGAIDPRTAVPNRVFEDYHREAMRRYGQSALLAWHEGGVVGFVNFHPLNAAFDRLCPHVDTPEQRERLARFAWPEKAAETLRILCVNAAPGFRRCGLGTEMVKALIRWAPDWGYRRLHVGANENAWWTPCRPFWEKLGFAVVETVEFDEPREDGERRIFVMERDV